VRLEFFVFMFVGHMARFITTKKVIIIKIMANLRGFIGFILFICLGFGALISIVLVCFDSF